MKFIIFFNFVFLIAIQSIAQRDPDKLFYAQKVEKYGRMKNTGATLTVTGGILVIVSISMLIKAGNTTNQNSTQQSLTAAEQNAILVYYLGAASLGAGIPLWIVGGHAQRKYERKFESISLRVNLTPQKTGLTLTYRF